MKTQTFQNLHIWQRAMDLVVSVYQTTSMFPAEERCGLASQMQRAAVLIPANIAGVYNRINHAEYERLLYHARGSLMRLETQLIIAQQLGYIQAETYQQQWSDTQEIERMLAGLIHAIKKPNS